MQLASLAMLNATFLKIFKHYELSKTSGKLTCLHKTSRHFRKGNSKLYCMSQPNITCADFELFEKTFSTCAWLRYNLPFFPFKTNYMQSDLKRWLMSRWQSFLLPMNIPFEYLCYLIYNDTPPYWWETGMKEAAKRKHISDLCPTLCSCGYRENKWLDINQFSYWWRIVSSPLSFLNNELCISK